MKPINRVEKATCMWSRVLRKAPKSRSSRLRLGIAARFLWQSETALLWRLQDVPLGLVSRRNLFLLQLFLSHCLICESIGDHGRNNLLGV